MQIMSELFRYSASPRFGEVEMPDLAQVNYAQRLDRYEVADEDQDSADRPQTMGVRITDQLGSEVTIIRPMPVTDEVGRVQLADDQGVYRALSGARVIGVDFPGMGTDTGPLTRSQRRDLARGSFKSVADKQWQVIESALKYHNSGLNKLGRVVLWGSSLGGAQIAALHATKPEEVEVSDLVFQMTPWQTKLGALALGFAEASKDRDYYYELDEENYHGRETDADWLKRIMTARKIGAMIAATFALAEGKTMDDLTSRSLAQTRIHIMNAEHDRISPTADNNAASDYLWAETNAHVARVMMEGEYHAIQQSRRVVGVQQKDIIDSYDHS